MKLSVREKLLACMTGTVVLFGMTYWLSQPKIEEWKNAGKEKARLTERITLAQRLLDQKGSVNKDLDEYRKQLPQYPAGQDVTSEMLKILERTAQENSLMLLRREPEKEKSVGDLFQITINCTWEAELDGLVRFLYALQIKGVILDVRQLSVTPGQGGPGRLKGSFSVDFAYTRPSSGLESVQVTPAAAP